MKVLELGIPGNALQSNPDLSHPVDPTARRIEREWNPLNPVIGSSIPDPIRNFNTNGSAQNPSLASTEPKPEVSSSQVNPDYNHIQQMEQGLDEIAHRLRISKKTVFIAGAGISSNAGIPDFRSKDTGLYSLVKRRFPTAVVRGRDLFDAILFRDAQSTKIFYSFMAELRRCTLEAKPTATHGLLKLFGDQGRLLRCYTQNIDGLETRAGLDGSKVVQLHGDLHVLRCRECRAEFGWSPEFEAEFSEGGAPDCTHCREMSELRVLSGKRATSVGVLRPDIVLYGEEHPEGDSITRQVTRDARTGPQMLVVMGTSLKVHGLKRLVKDMARATHDKGGLVIFVNKTPVSTSEWGGIFDYHVAANTDSWVRDLRHRQPRMFEVQSTLNVAVKRRTTSAPKTAKKQRSTDGGDSTSNDFTGETVPRVGGQSSTFTPKPEFSTDSIKPACGDCFPGKIANPDLSSKVFSNIKDTPGLYEHTLHHSGYYFKKMSPPTKSEPQGS